MKRGSSPSISPTSRLGSSYKNTDEIWFDGVGDCCASVLLIKRVACKENCRNLF